MLCTARSPMPTSLAISANRTSVFWAIQTNTCAWFVRNVHDGTTAVGDATPLTTPRCYNADGAISWPLQHGLHAMVRDSSGAA